MTTEQVASMVSDIGLPYAYYEFPDNTDLTPPFVSFLFTNSADVYADDENYVDKRTLVIELYTAAKDFDLEQTVRGVLKSHNMTFTMNADHLDSEQMFVTTFTTEVIIDGEQD